QQIHFADAHQLAEKIVRKKTVLAQIASHAYFGRFESLRRLINRRALDAPQTEPIKLVRSQRQQIGQLSNAREDGLARHFNRYASLVTAQIELDGLRSLRKIVHHQHALVPEFAHVGKNSVV